MTEGTLQSLSKQYRLTLHFFESEPVASARRLETLPAQVAASLISEAPESTATQLLNVMLPSVASKIFASFDERQQALLSQSLEVATLAAILRHIQEKQRSAILVMLSRRKRALCEMLISYPEYTIGSIVETDVLVVDSHMVVKEVQVRLKKQNYAYLQYVYVVNQSRQLLGQVQLSEILRAELTSNMASLLVEPVKSITASADLKVAEEWGAWRQADALPVVNRQQEFIGVLFHHRVRQFLAKKHSTANQPQSLSSDLLEIYGDTIITMVELMQPFKKVKHN